MLKEVPGLEDAQIALKILSQCLGSCRVMYTMRTTRPAWIRDALQEGDLAMRETLESVIGLPFSNEQWMQATLSLNQGGLGLRSAALHASAAYLSSRTATRELCAQIDPNYVWNDGADDGWLPETIEAYNASVQPDEGLSSASCTARAPLSQKKLSKQTDTTLRKRLLGASLPVDRARLHAVSAPHASRWLQA